MEQKTPPASGKKQKLVKAPVYGGKLEVNPGDNSTYLSLSLDVMNLPRINILDQREVTERIRDYFQLCMDRDAKPTVTGLAMALGMDRRRLWEVTHDVKSSTLKYNQIPENTKDFIKKAYGIMENLWENYMINGKINPVTGIFLSKNYFGYRDETELSVTSQSPLGDAPSGEEIARRYAGSIVREKPDE